MAVASRSLFPGSPYMSTEPVNENLVDSKNGAEVRFPSCPPGGIPPGLPAADELFTDVFYLRPFIFPCVFNLL